MTESTTPSNSLQGVLEGLSLESDGVLGTVVATPDGLVLAATGTLKGDLAAASAAGLLQQVDEVLAALSSSLAQHLLLWSEPNIWYVTRLADGHLLMLCCAHTLPAGAVRLLGHLGLQRLNPLLALETAASAPITWHDTTAKPASPTPLPDCGGTP